MNVLKRENTQLFIAAIAALLLLAFMNSQAHAALKPITCKTNFGEKSFTIDHASIAFHSEDKTGRSISSVMDSVTKKTHIGFNKTTYKNGSKHLIHVQDENKFDSNEDFLAITSPKGHKMTYPLICSRVE